MKSKIILITPEMAQETLKRNTLNRTVRRKTVASYAAAMQAGMWKENGEPIIIGHDNILIDGQHRLLAIVASGKTLRMLVAFDVDPSTRDTVDGGLRRTNGDVLSIEGITNGPRVSACIIGLAYTVQGYRPQAGTIPRELVINAYIENEAQVNAVIISSTRATSASGHRWEPAEWTSALVIAQHALTEEQYERAIEVMSGYNVEPGTFSERSLRVAKKIKYRDEAFAQNAALKAIIGMGINRYVSPLHMTKIINNFKDNAGPATKQLIEWKVTVPRK